MQITVRLLAGYSRYLPESRGSGSSYPLVVEPGTRLGALLHRLPVPATEAVTCLVNGAHADPEMALNHGDIVAVFPAVGGG